MTLNLWVYALALYSLIYGSAAVYFVQERPTFCLPAHSKPGTIVGRLFAEQNSIDACVDQSLSYGVIGNSFSFAVNASGWISLIEDMSEINKGFFMNVSASCVPHSEGVSKHEAFSSVNVEVHDVQSQIVDTSSINENRLRQMCFDGFPESFSVEENRKDVSLGIVNSCVDKSGFGRTFSIAKHTDEIILLSVVFLCVAGILGLFGNSFAIGFFIKEPSSPFNGRVHTTARIFSMTILIAYYVGTKNRFKIDDTSSEIILTQELDRESLTQNSSRGEQEVNGIQRLVISCTLWQGSRLFPPVTKRFNVTVLDVNDNPPIFIQHNNSQTKEVVIDLSESSNYKIGEIVFDKDECIGCNVAYRFKSLIDPLDICKPQIQFYPAFGKSMGWFSIELQHLSTITDTLYQCQVALIDPGFTPTTNSKYTNQVSIRVLIHRPRQEKVTKPQNLTQPQKTNFFRNATRLARLLQLHTDQSTRYTLNNDIFRVTSRTGIVYVYDVAALSNAPDSVSLSVVKSNGGGVNIIVNLFGTARGEICEDMCARHDSRVHCEGSCGLGLVGGACVMRGSEKDRGMSRTYGTCTYDPVHCPDGVCDELEDMFPTLCPQDCTVDDVVGFGNLNTSSSPPRGILEAKSPCWCDDEIVCSCMPIPDLTPSPLDPPVVAVNTKEVPTSRSSTTSTAAIMLGDKGVALVKTLVDSEDTVTTLYNITDQSQMVALVTEGSTSSCGKACWTAIGLGIGAVIAISFSLFMLWFTKRRNDRRKNNLKHVGSVVSMSAVPSDYVEDRERQMSYSSPSWSPKGPINPSHIHGLHYEHSKWEIPRENLSLEKTLGEGEFGLVMKARAVGIGGDNKEKEVAVKMLKHCSTSLEEQDLWSEFTLLTDVSHPNVIRLLGACTGDGPFYVIVEYCEHGCLLKYLRRSRLVENGYINTRMRCTSPNANEQIDPTMEGDLLDLRDLLSFAWQIAKGMSYLSEIKLVHRDLAARNVLVASGKLLKISDFGLTRDVYEADTYLKKSRGRIPVKWLAPESLYAQIYTTRSDVWSYGIVLWEIVTLGAPPYPGIPPERLYNLLMGGYRMDRPENCPDEMYAVMQKCWKIDSADRPSFACLANIFDRILQEKTGYLDLSQGTSIVHDLYSKCFDSNGTVRDIPNSRESVRTDVDVDVHRTPSCDVIDNMNMTTVTNELYNQDTYLEPTKSPTAEDDNKTIPLLVENKLGSNEVVLKIEVPSVEKINENTEKEKEVSSFIKKILENKSPGHSKNGGNKNKNVIYPCEKLSLLMDNGTARFSTSVHGSIDEPDETLRIELD